MSLVQGNNTPTRPRIEPGSPDPESDALTTRPVRPPQLCLRVLNVGFEFKFIDILVWFDFKEKQSRMCDFAVVLL